MSADIHHIDPDLDAFVGDLIHAEAQCECGYREVAQDEDHACDLAAAHVAYTGHSEVSVLTSWREIGNG